MEKLSNEERLLRFMQALSMYRTFKMYCTDIDRMSKDISGKEKSIFEYDENEVTASFTDYLNNMGDIIASACINQNPTGPIPNSVNYKKYVRGINKSAIDLINSNEEIDSLVKQIENDIVGIYGDTSTERAEEEKRFQKIRRDFNNKENCLGNKRILLKNIDELGEYYDEIQSKTYIAKAIYQHFAAHIKTKAQFSIYAERGIRDIMLNRTITGNDERQKRDTLEMLKYFSEYLPKAERENLCTGGISEDDLIAQMEEKNTPIFLKGEEARKSIELGLGTPRCTLDHFFNWYANYAERYMDSINSNDDLPFLYNPLEFVRLTRNSIAHGTFLYNPEKRILKIIGPLKIDNRNVILIDDGEYVSARNSLTQEEIDDVNANRIKKVEKRLTGSDTVEMDMSVDCVLNLCRNYFYATSEPETRHIIEKKPEEFDAADAFRYYINALFSCNSWISSEKELKRIKTLSEDEKRYPSCKKLCNFLENGFFEKFKCTEMKNETENINGVDVQKPKWMLLLKHLRNAAAHGRIKLDKEKKNIIIKDIDPRTNETTFEGKIAVGKFKKILNQCELSTLIESAMVESYSNNTLSFERAQSTNDEYIELENYMKSIQQEQSRDVELP